jgi:hypothetical protein
VEGQGGGCGECARVHHEHTPYPPTARPNPPPVARPYRRGGTPPSCTPTRRCASLATMAAPSGRASLFAHSVQTRVPVQCHSCPGREAGPACLLIVYVPVYPDSDTGLVRVERRGLATRPCHALMPAVFVPGPIDDVSLPKSVPQGCTQIKSRKYVHRYTVSKQ